MLASDRDFAMGTQKYFALRPGKEIPAHPQ
jgi:hypothetical protein